MENQENLKNLFSKYLNNSCSVEEVNLLLDHFALKNEEGLLKQMIQLHFEAELAVHSADEKTEAALLEVKDMLLAKLRESEPVNVQFNWSVFYKIAAAAVVLLTFSAGLYFYWERYPTAGKDLYSFNKANDIAPGKNMATLTLANGSTINLNDSKNGIVIDTGAIRYASKNQQTALSVHAITTKEQLSIKTPRGGTYQVVLSDGTKIWLNAASSLKFPSTFTGLKDRRIELQGEAYFEVAKDKTHPFKVLNGKQEVEVLGTHFNINSYKDQESVNTTLIEGSVRVTAGSGQIVQLVPAQQSVLIGENIVVRQVNVDEAIAWKNGLFLFNGTDFRSVMQQLGRWYNVEIDMRNLPDKEFNGLISRNVKLSEVLRALEMTSNVRFKIEGRRVTIE